MRPLLPAFLLLTACRPGDGFEISLEQSAAIPTVYTAHWSAELDTIDAAWWELGRPDHGVERILPVDTTAGPEFETTLYGMKPGESYRLWAVVESDGEILRSDEHRVETGLLPPELPELSVERAEGAETWEGLLVTTIAAMPPTAVMIDVDGDIVWWHMLDGVENLARARLDVDGRHMLMLDMNLEGSALGALYRIDLAGEERALLPSANFHHDFALRADGTVAALAYDPMDIGGISVPGDRIVELSPDGETRVVYDVWEDDEVEYSPADAYMGRMWPHANAIDISDDGEAYLVSFLSLDSVVRIDRATGKVDWRVGGRHSDVTTADGGTELFDHQHQFHWLGDRLLAFENGPLSMGVSAALEYAVDLEGGQVELAWEHPSSLGLSSPILGDVQRLEGGDTLITWSYAGRIEQVTPEHEVSWALQASVGGAFGYTELLTGLPLQ